MPFWERFYALCKTKGTTPNAVAKELGLSTATCTQWKSGSIPNGERLVQIANYFNVSVDYLLGNEPAEAPALDKTESEILILARKTKDLPEADRKKLVRLFESSINTFLEAQKKDD